MPESADLFFDALVDGYVRQSPRFVRRDWLARDVAAQLNEPGKSFVLLTAEPGAGKSAFMAQLASDNHAWLRYFIRRDQHQVLADVSDRSLLLRAGYQLAARSPDLFPEPAQLSVQQTLGEVAERAEVVGAEITRLVVSPFQRNVLTIRQNVRANRGRVVGLRVEELIVDERLLSAEDLLEQALLRPAQELLRVDPARQIVVLIDALDEIGYHATQENILAWLTNCPELPPNVRFVLSSRPPDSALQLFCEKQSSRLARVAIDEGDVRVAQDVAAFVQSLLAEPDVAQALDASEQRADTFAARAQEKAHGNLGYLDALARGIQQALARKDAPAVQLLLGLGELPADLTQLYGFFLEQIRASVARERIELRDRDTGEAYDKPAWPAVYDPLLGVLAVATRPLELDLLLRLSGIRVDPVWVTGALDRLTQFLDVIDGRYRLYHATVAEYLTSGRSLVDAGNWHRRIAGHYWANQRDWSQCDSYGLDSLALHLSKSNDSPRLLQLVDPSWMRARVAAQATSYRGFFADLDAVKQDLRGLAHAADCSPSLVCKAVRVMLVRTSINSVTTANAPAFVAQAVARGMWPAERALNVARQLPDADDRAYMYLSLLRTAGLSGVARQCAADEALEAALGILRDVEQGRVLAKLAPFLDEPGQLDKAWHTASKIRSKWREVRAVTRTALAIRMNGEAKEQALRKALEDSLNADDGDPMDTLPTLAPHLSEDLKSLALKNEGTLPEAIEALRSQLSESALAELSRRAMDVRDTELRIRILGRLAPGMPADQSAEMWVAVLAGIAKTRGYVRRKLLREIAPSIGDSLVVKTLEIALDIPDAVERAQAMAAVAPRLSGADRARTVVTALRIAKRSHRDELIEELLPLLNAQQLRSLGSLALAADTWLDSDVTRSLLSRLPTELGAELLTRLSGLHSEDFVKMVESLPEERRREWIQPLYAIASELRTPRGQAEAFEPIAKYLSDETIARALRQNLSASERKAIEHLQGLISAVIETGNVPAPEPDPDDDQERTTARPETARDALVQALSQVRTGSRAAALERVFSEFRGPELDAHMVGYLEALETATGWEWGRRSGDFAALAPHLDGSVRDKAIEVGAQYFREAYVDALVALADADHLTDEQVQRVFAVALEEARPNDDMFSSQSSRIRRVEAGQAQLLARLAPKLAETQLMRGLAKLQKGFGEEKVTALAAIAPHLREPQRGQAIADGLEAASRADRDFAERMFRSLSPLIGPDQRVQAIQAAESVYSPMARAHALCGLRPSFAPAVDLAPRIRRALVHAILEDYDDQECSRFLAVVERELLPRSLLDVESLRAIADDLTEITTRWEWL